MSSENQSSWVVPFIPVTGTTLEARTSLHRALLWEARDGSTVFTPQAVAATGVTDLLDPHLHPIRLRRLASLARSAGTRLEPPTERLASWAEGLAGAAVRDTWSRSRRNCQTMAP